MMTATLKAFIVAASLWINAHTGLPLLTEVPRIEQRTSTELFVMMYKDDKDADKYDIMAVTAYDTIYLRNTFDERDILDLSILVHELVHVMQNLSDVEYACIIENEQEAYELQSKWLAQNGVNYYDKFDTLYYQAIQDASCP